MGLVKFCRGRLRLTFVVCLFCIFVCARSKASKGCQVGSWSFGGKDCCGGERRGQGDQEEDQNNDYFPTPEDFAVTEDPEVPAQV